MGRQNYALLQFVRRLFAQIRWLHSKLARQLPIGNTQSGHRLKQAILCCVHFAKL